MDKFSDNKFQIINMNYKLKKIKNRKKNNYKNIETFEILDNKQKVENNDTNKNYTISDKLNKKNENEIEPFVSGTNFNTIEGFPNDYYDGIDNLKESRDDIAGTFSLSDFIEKIYNYINQFNHMMSEKLANSLSKNTATENDIFIIRQYFVWTESILASMYVSYNMYFIMYYKDVENIRLTEISMKKMRELEKTILFLIPFNYAFEYSITILEFSNWLITKIIPEYTKKVLNTTFIFTIIFILLIFFFKYFALYFKNFLINAINFKYDYFMFMIGIVVLALWLLGVLKVGKEKAERYSKGEQEISYVDLALFALNRVIKLLASLFMGVPMTLFMLALYILVYTFVAIFFYVGFDTSIFIRINEYISLTKNTKIESVCDETNWFEEIKEFSGMNLIMIFVETLFSNLFLIAFIILYLTSCGDYKNNISSDAVNLKNSLIFINLMIIIILSFIVGKSYMKYFI